MTTPTPQQSPTQLPQMSTSAQPTFNDEKEHYKSLISLFKFCIGIIPIIGIAIGYFIYSNGQEMRQAMKDEREEMRSQLKEEREETTLALKETKADFDRQLEDFRGRESRLESKALQAVEDTKLDAQARIAGVNSLATAEARDRINEVFREKNLDAFIDRVAEQRIEPKVQAMVDSKMKQIDALNDKKVQYAIVNLSNPNSSISMPAMSYLEQNQDYTYASSQIDEIINKFLRLPEGSPLIPLLSAFISNMNDRNQFSEAQVKLFLDKFQDLPSASMLASLVLTFLNKFDSEEVDSFFKDLAFKRIRNHVNDFSSIDYARDRFVSKNHLQNVSFYIAFLNQFKGSSSISGEYNSVVSGLSFTDFKSTKELLNNKELVDSVLQYINWYRYTIFLNQTKEALRIRLNPDFLKEGIDSTYYFVHVPADVKVYPEYNEPPVPRRRPM